MRNKRSKIIVVILVLIINLVLALIFINNYNLAQYSKQLITAIQKDDMETAQNCLKQCPNCVNSLPSSMPYFIRTIMDYPEICYPLQQACIWENFDMVKLLVEYGANVNCVSRGIESTVPPLSTIVKTHIGWFRENRPIDEEDLDIIRLLLENGADKTIKDSYGKTAYDYAVELNDSNLEELLKY